MMLYTPRRKAKVEFTAAQKKPRVMPPPNAKLSELEQPSAATIHEAAPEIDPLVSNLVSFRVGEQTARELMRDYWKTVELQLRALPHRNLAKIRDLASWLIVAIKENHQLPEAISEA